MANLCVIPARGGSKRIPRKNIKPFIGKPMIQYSIELAKSSGLFNEIIVSTDDKEIKDIAKSSGATVPFLRSSKNSGDFASTSEVLLEVLIELKKMGLEYHQTCCLYPCAPLMTKVILSEAWKLLIDNNYDSLVPTVKYGHPIQRALVLKENLIEFSHPENSISRSQDLEECYHDAGQFYLLKNKPFFEQKKLFMERTGTIILSEKTVQDIDTIEDWKIAELKYKLLNA